MKISNDIQKNTLWENAIADRKNKTGKRTLYNNTKDQAILNNSIENLINIASKERTDQEKISQARQLIQSRQIDSLDFVYAAAEKMLKFGI